MIWMQVIVKKTLKEEDILELILDKRKKESIIVIIHIKSVAR